MLVKSKSADPGELPREAAFNLGLHCLSKAHLRVASTCIKKAKYNTIQIY